MTKWLVFGFFAAGCGFPRPADVEPTNDAGGMPVSCMRTTCTAGVLSVCDTSGVVDHTERCALDCFSDGSRCQQVAPSNGLDAALEMAAVQGPITLPSGSVIDTDTGTVTAAGTSIVVASVTLAQVRGPMLRVLLAKSWRIRDVRVRGASPVVFVASKEIAVEGVVDGSADGNVAGPGAIACGAPGVGGEAYGFFVRVRPNNSGGYPEFLWASNGFGGGGFGTAGGAGGVTSNGMQVGVAGLPNGNPELVPLRGGCDGGGDLPSDPVQQHHGAGGGAIQFVAGEAFRLVATGTSKGGVHVGGGGSVAGALGRVATSDTTPVWGPGGGGSGGGLLIEAPVVILDAGTTLLAGGGGGGGYGACSPVPSGRDAAQDAETAEGGSCPAGTTPTAAGGAGAIAGDGRSGESEASAASGGGGGGLGRIRINTSDAQYAAGPTTLVRGVVTTGLVGRR
jgi:hypothetical protein